MNPPPFMTPIVEFAMTELFVVVKAFLMSASPSVIVLLRLDDPLAFFMLAFLSRELRKLLNRRLEPPCPVKPAFVPL